MWLKQQTDGCGCVYLDTGVSGARGASLTGGWLLVRVRQNENGGSGWNWEGVVWWWWIKREWWLALCHD